MQRLFVFISAWAVFAGFGCSASDGDMPQAAGGEGGELAVGGQAGVAGDDIGGEAGTNGQAGAAGESGGQGGTTSELVGTESDPQPPTPRPLAMAPAFRATFANALELQNSFVVTEGAQHLSVADGALTIASGRAATVLVDTTPLAAPGETFSGDLTLQFRVKGDTTPWVPSTAVGKGRYNDVWIVLPQGNRANAPRISFRWSEADEDSLSFRTGADVSDATKDGTRVDGLIFSTPAYAGNVWYTVRVVIKAQAGGQGMVYAQVFDGPILVMSSQANINGLSTNTEVAIGGKAGLGGRLSPLLIDDIEVWTSAAVPAPSNAVYHRTSVNGMNVQMWIPPGLSKVNGVFLETPGAGGDTSGVTELPWYQSFAELHGYAIVGHAVGLDPSGMMQGLSQLAAASNHDEIKTVPVIAYGFSRGARNIIYMMNEFPQRLITYVGDSAPIAPNPSAAASKIPGTFVFGQNDTTGNDRVALFAVQKRTRANGGYMAVLEKQGLPHTPMSTYFYFLPFFDRMLRTIHPDPSKAVVSVNPSDAWLLEAEGWLGSGDFQEPAPLVNTAPEASYTGDKTNTGWFANRDLAYLAAAYTGFRRVVVVSPIHHGVEGDSRGVRIRHVPEFSDWEKIELFDFGKLIHTFRPGDKLVYQYESLSAGVHSIAAHITRAAKVYPSFPAMVIMKKRP